MTITAPCVVWAGPGSYAGADGVSWILTGPPPVDSLAGAEIVDWCPRLQRAHAVVGGDRRDLTDDECALLEQWVHGVAAEALDARDGGRTLAVVIGA